MSEAQPHVLVIDDDKRLRDLIARYLTEQGFAHTPALLGEVVRIDPKGVRHVLAIAQAFVRNQGDAWTWTLELLARGLSDITSGDEATAR